MTASTLGTGTQADWLIYGAYGYTGKLVTEEAVRRGHRPVLAGRSAEKLVPLAEQLGLDWIVVDLHDAGALTAAVAQVDLVFHAAGPFSRTSDPMIRACLTAGTNYVDIAGEIPVFRNTFSYDQTAIQRGIVLISGAGFDVIPTDCMAEHIANQVPNAVELEIAIAGLSGDHGSTKTMLKLLPHGAQRRRGGKLVSFRWGKGAKQVPFLHGERTVVPVPRGDLETAFQTTGIPNITSYMAFPKSTIHLLPWMAPVGQKTLGVKAIQRMLRKGMRKTIQGPDEETRRKGRSYVWARATDGRGREAQAWLETLEEHQFTATGGVCCVERILEDHPVGALTPALALGADFVLQIEGTRRVDGSPTGP